MSLFRIGQGETPRIFSASCEPAIAAPCRPLSCRYFLGPRNCLWHPPQPFFPRLPNAVAMAVLSPDLAAWLNFVASALSVAALALKPLQFRQISGLARVLPASSFKLVPLGKSVQTGDIADRCSETWLTLFQSLAVWRRMGPWSGGSDRLWIFERSSCVWR